MLQILLSVTRNRGFRVLRTLYDHGFPLPVERLLPGTPASQARATLARMVLGGLVVQAGDRPRTYRLSPLGREWWGAIRQWDVDETRLGPVPDAVALAVQQGGDADGEAE